MTHPDKCASCEAPFARCAVCNLAFSVDYYLDPEKEAQGAYCAGTVEYLLEESPSLEMIGERVPETDLVHAPLCGKCMGEVVAFLWLRRRGRPGLA